MLECLVVSLLNPARTRERKDHDCEILPERDGPSEASMVETETFLLKGTIGQIPSHLSEI